MRILIGLFILVSLFGCGKEARERRLLEPLTESNPLVGNYAYGACGSISYEQGNGPNGSNAYFLTNNQAQKYMLKVISPAAQNVLSQFQLNTQAAGCVYSNRQSYMDLDGQTNVIDVEEVTL